jgi:hypothetical protein
MSVQLHYSRKVVIKKCFQEKLSPVLEVKSDLMNDAQYNILLTEFMTSDTCLFTGEPPIVSANSKNKIIFPRDYSI